MVCCRESAPWLLTLDCRNQGSEILRRVLRGCGVAAADGGAASPAAAAAVGHVGKVKGERDSETADAEAAPLLAVCLGDVLESSSNVDNGVFCAESASDGDGDGSPMAMGALNGGNVNGVFGIDA